MSDPDAPQPAEPQAPPARRRRRRLLWAAGLVGGLALLVALALFWALGSGGGAGFTIARLSQVLPGALTVERVEGPIRGPLILHGVRYETERFIVEIEWVRLDWRLRQLARRIVDVESLEARGVVVTILPSDRVEDRKLRDINLRWNVVVRSLEVEDVKVFRPEQPQPVVVDRLTMETGAWRDAVRIEDVDVVSPHLDLDARGWLRPTGDYPLDVAVAWAYRPPEDAARKLPGFAGRGQLSGTLRALRVEQQLEQPFRATIAGTIAEPLFDPRFEGDVRAETFDPRLFDPDLPVTRASGEAHVSGSGVAEFTARGRARLATVEWGEADAEFALARDAEQWRFAPLRLRRPGGGPARARFDGTFATPEGQPFRFEGKAEWESLTWPLDASDPAVTSARGTAAGEGTVEDYTLVVDGVFAFPNVPAGRYAFTAEGDRDSLDVSSLDARVLGGRLAGGGRVSWKPRVAYSFRATATGIDPHATWSVVPAAFSGGVWRLAGEGDQQAVRLTRVEIETPAGGRLDGSGRVRWEPAFGWEADARTRGISPAVLFPEVPAQLAGGDWHFVASGDDRSADIARAEGAFLDGEVVASGKVRWEPAVAWEITGTGRSLDPAVAYPGWGGDLTVDFRTSGQQRGEGLEGEVVVSRADGMLRGRPLAGSGIVLLRGDAVLVDDVKATWGPGTVAADGQISPTLQLTFAVDELELAGLMDGLGGVVEARGTIAGAAAAPRIDATLDGRNVAFRDYRAATVVGRAEVDLAQGGAVDLDLDATEVDLGTRSFGTLSVVATGTREAHRVAATGTGEGLSLAVAATGSMPDLRSWRGTLEQLTAETPEAGRWELAAPTPLVLSATAVEVDQLCWVSAGARLCADVSWRSDEALAVTANVEDLPLSLLEPFLPAEVEVAGTLDGSARLRTTRDGGLLGEAVLRPAPGSALWDESRGEDVRLAVEGGEIRLVADGAAAHATLRLALAGAGSVQGEATLPGFRLGRPAEQQPVRGRVEIALSDIAFLEALVPELGTTSGLLVGQVAIAGTLARPDLRGQARLADGRVTLPRFGLDLSEVTVEARGDGTGPLALTGSLRSGDGTLQFTGTTPLLPNREQPLRLDFTGRNVTVMATDEARVIANPDLQLAWDGSLVRVAGQVVVPRARIDYQRDERVRVRASQDVVYVGAVTPEAVADPGLEVQARVRVVLGEDVELRAMGLKTNLEGSLLVVDAPGLAAPTASGELRLEQGSFRAYGQDLTIERGRLNFAGGPLSNPGIDVRAYRQIPEGNVRAGLHARGNIRAPEITLWSEPAMGESEVLSYLLLGRPLEAAQPEEGSMLANAAGALGLGGGNLLAKKLAARWGLEEARFDTGGQGYEQAAFVVGKYLSPRLYVSYGIGLFEAVNTLRIRYLISEKLTLQAQSGAVTSGDVLYTMERGGPRAGEPGGGDVPELPLVSREELATPAQIPVGARGQGVAAEEEAEAPLLGGEQRAPDVEGEGDPE